MSSSDKKRRRIAVNEYAIKTVSYLIIMLAVTVAAVFVLIKPVTELVHKVESYVPMESRDIVLDDSTYNLSVDEKSISFDSEYEDVKSMHLPICLISKNHKFFTAVL